MPSWIKHFYIGTHTRYGFMPVPCVTCKKDIELKDAFFWLGYWRHKKCYELVSRREL